MFALCFWLAVRLFRDSSIHDVETLVLVLMSAMTMLAHVSAISIPLAAVSAAMNAARIFFTIIDAPRPETTGVRNDKLALEGDIIFDKVMFSYPAASNVPILRGLSLRIPARKITAIVGPSGSGKSTLVALLQRWYELGALGTVAPHSSPGTIKVGGRNLGEFDVYSWRSRIGMVQQEPFLFDDTIYKNIEYGLVGTQWEYAPANVKSRMVMSACRQAYADEFIQKLPEVRNAALMRD